MLAVPNKLSVTKVIESAYFDSRAGCSMVTIRVAIISAGTEGLHCCFNVPLSAIVTGRKPGCRTLIRFNTLMNIIYAWADTRSEWDMDKVTLAFVGVG